MPLPVDTTTPQTAPERQIPRSDADTMRAFLQEHGGAPEAPAGGRSSGRAETETPDAGEGDSDLDLRTLQALGLMPEDAAGEPADDEGDGDEDGAQDQRQVDLEQLAKVLGLSPEDLSYNKDTGVKLKTKIDGEAGEVSLAEIRKGYQLQKHFTIQQEQFLAERKAWEDQRALAAAQYQQQATLAAQILKQEEADLQRQYTRDWDTLRRDDPAEYAALVAEYNQRLHGLRQRQQGLTQAVEQQAREFHEKRVQQHQEVVQRESAAMREALRWDTPEKAKAGAMELKEYLSKTVGFSEADINSITDHRAYLLADKARRYDAMMARLATAQKKVSEAPPMPADRGGSVPKPQGGQRKKVQQAQQRLARDHSVESAAEVFKHLKVV